MKKKTSRHGIDVDVDELDRIIDAAMREPLNETDGKTLKTAVHAMAERLVRRRNTEKTSAVLEPKTTSGTGTATPESAHSGPAGHGRNPANAFTGAEKVRVKHAQLKPGDVCPECREGKVYCQKEPKTLVRIVGRPPLQATVFEMERLRCNGCGEVFAASDPQSAGPEKFDATAVATTALLKYGTGMPFNRLEQLEKHLGIPFPASVQWELMKRAAGLLRFVLKELIRQAAQGSVMHNDDTGMRILRLARNTDDGRTGTFTSGIVSILREWRIALYFTGWKHAGENLADVLKQRALELDALIQMCNALSRNTPKVIGVQILLAYCLSHGRRQFVDTAKRASKTSKPTRVFGQRQEPAKMFRVGLYARVSTHDQQTLPLQMRAMREYAAKRGWTISVQIKEVGSGAAERELREELMAAARRREIDVVLVWRLDRWGRSLVDLVVTLKELAELGVAFVSLTEALDLTTPTGRAMAGLLSVFAAFEHEILRERVRAGIAEARLQGKHLGRPVSWKTGQPDPETPPCWCQQSRDRPPSQYQLHFRAPDSDNTAS